MSSKRETMKIKISDETWEAVKKYRDRWEGKSKTPPKHDEENGVNEEIIKINEEIYNIKSDLRYIDTMLNSEIRIRRHDDRRHDEYEDNLYELKNELCEFKEKIAQLQNILFDFVLYLASLFDVVRQMEIVPKNIYEIAYDPKCKKLLQDQAALIGVNLEEYIYQKFGEAYSDHNNAHLGEDGHED